MHRCRCSDRNYKLEKTSRLRCSALRYAQMRCSEPTGVRIPIFTLMQMSLLMIIRRLSTTIKVDQAKVFTYRNFHRTENYQSFGFIQMRICVSWTLWTFWLPRYYWLVHWYSSSGSLIVTSILHRLYHDILLKKLQNYL